MNYFEDIRVGTKTVIGSHTFTAQDIKAYAVQFDPQPFHLDEAAGKRSHFGALCASGWHTATLWMRLAVAHYKAEDDAKRARGEPVAKLGPSPGFRDLKWLKPVYAGDTITYATEVLDKRTSNSRPGIGIVTALNTGTNQAGDLVISFVSSVFVERRIG